MNPLAPLRLVSDAGAPAVEWIETDGQRFSEPFFEDTLARFRRRRDGGPPPRHRTSLDALRDVPEGVPPAALIFHVSRCGSTLVAQMLGAIDRHVVVAEPPILDELLRATPGASDEDRIAWLRGAVRALGRAAPPGGERLFVKLDCWHLFHLPLLDRAFPEVPFWFVHRDPLEVLVSLMRRPSLTLVRDTVTPLQLGLTTAERDALSREEHAAAILGAFYRAAATHRARLVPVPYAALPQVLWTLPGGAWSEEDRARALAAAGRDAKNPARIFAPDTLEKRREADPALIAACERWAATPYARWRQPA